MNAPPRMSGRAAHIIEGMEVMRLFVLQACGAGPFGLYAVRPGDSLQRVCAAHGVAYASVVEENRLDRFPPPGSLLLLPRGENCYAVRPGDTIEAICSKFSISEEEFCARNRCTYVYPTQRVWVGPSPEAR